MQGAQAVLAIVAPPCRLAVHRQDGLLDSGRRSRLGAQRLQPVGEAGLEGRRFQGHEETAEDILTGDPVGQVKHLQEELLFQVGPPAPASTASKAMTTTLSKGCRRLTSERGSSSSSKCRTTSSNPICRMSAMVHPLWRCSCRNHTGEGIPENNPGRKYYKLPRLPISARWPWTWRSARCLTNGPRILISPSGNSTSSTGRVRSAVA